ncbi:hypothetical protein BESB_025590, partial [Besnoitia besnoiti]
LALSPAEAKMLSIDVSRATPPGDIARALALAAYWRSLDSCAQTPFAKEARKQNAMQGFAGQLGSAFSGLTSGGKEDDITVAAAWVVSETDARFEHAYELRYGGVAPHQAFQAKTGSECLFPGFIGAKEWRKTEVFLEQVTSQVDTLPRGVTPRKQQDTTITGGKKLRRLTGSIMDLVCAVATPKEVVSVIAHFPVWIRATVLHGLRVVFPPSRVLPAQHKIAGGTS